MKLTTYNSAAARKIPTLAEATFQVFSPFLSRYQWALDDPTHSPRAEEITSAINNRGRKGSNTFLRADGWKYILRPLQSWAFEQAIARKHKIYYVSYGSQALLYFDVDLHYAWQTAEECQKPACCWTKSSRNCSGQRP